MPSPFSIFRKHQKTGMVILVGLSMIGFVLLGAVNDPTNIPKPLVFISIIAVVAGAAWIAGMRSKKSAEYGSWGVVLGAAVAFFITMSGGPPAALKADSGDLSLVDLQDLRNRRRLANDFIGQVLFETRDPREINFLAQQYQFGFGFDGGVLSDRDVITSELLRREAGKLGLDVTLDSVYAYIKQISDGKLTSGKFKEIRTRLGLSETELHSILEDELQTRLAAEYLYDYEFDDLFRYSPTLTPEEYWEFYKRMYVSQQAEVAAIPVKDFVDDTQEPSPNELAKFFEDYRHNFPNLTAKGELEEGRPGFQQPRRVQLAYFEAEFEDYREGIAPVTEDDIRARYEEEYVKPAEDAAARAAEQERADSEKQPTGPALPGQPGTSADPADPATPPTESPEEENADPGAGSETPAPSETTPEPGTPESSTSEPSTPESETTEPAAPESSETPESATPSDEETPPQAGLIPNPTELQSVALFQEPTDPASDAPADAAPASESEPAVEPEPSTPADSAETPPAESTPEETSSSSADPPADAGGAPESEPTGDSATETPTEGAPGTGTPPPSPSTTVPLLDEALKTQIRIDIENERITERLRSVAAEAANFVDDVALLMNVPDDDPTRITASEAASRLQKYADEHQLIYAETPFLSADELSKSEDHPVGQAIAGEGQNQQLIPNTVFQTNAQDTYRPITASHPVTDSWFVTWKTGDREHFVPDDMSDERVREQVVTAWREFQARDKAKARAEELAKLINDTAKPMGELLGEQTVTGKEGEVNITIAETGEFRWLSIPGAPQPNPFSFYPPEIQDPPGVEKAGPDFMKSVFSGIDPGEAGVAANFDRSVYYVVRVAERTPLSTDEVAFDDFRKRFLYEPVFEQNDFLAQFGLDPRSVYQRLAVRTMVEYQSDWVDALWKRHNAELYEQKEGAS